jgi:hypothetical protein
MALTPSADADPIFAAMDAHRDRMDVTDRANERLAAAGPDGDSRPMQAALWAEHAAAKALIETAPTTRAGLRALESYLREDRNNNARMGIQMTGTMESGRTYTWSSGGPESVDWLIAKRAAEIVGVA